MKPKRSLEELFTAASILLFLIQELTERDGVIPSPNDKAALDLAGEIIADWGRQMRENEAE